MKIPVRSKHGTEQGFVLVAVIVLLTIFAIGAALFSLWTEERMADAIHVKEQHQLKLNALSTRNALLYLLATETVSPLGLETAASPNATDLSASSPTSGHATIPETLLRLDDIPYKGYGDCIFSIQDEAGLLLLNFFSRRSLSHLLGQLGVPFPEQAPLLDTLLDYQDANDLVRLNGAEHKQYRQAGRQAPPNRQLLTTWEIAAVLHWRNKVPVQRLARLCTLQHAGALAINSAASQVIQTLPGLDGSDAEKILRFREKIPITNLEQLQMIVGKNVAHLDMEVMFMPSLAHRITFWNPAHNRAEEWHITLTLFGEHQQPWIIDGPFTFSTIDSFADETCTKNEVQELPFFKNKISAKGYH